jgi:DNA-binding NarL/FixJ family response regulator
VVDILQAAGWTKTKRIKDVRSIDESDVSEANIIFVDVQGVGKMLKFKDEGLGLTIALKEKYPSKKVVVYSAEDDGKIETFHKALSVADERLSKNADPYEFQSLVERFSKEAFSFDECILRIQKVIQQESGLIFERDEIVKNMLKIYNKGKYTEKTISDVFNLPNAASIASIIQLFLTAR